MAFDAVLEIDGILGESTDNKHKNSIEVFSIDSEVSQPSTGAVSGGWTRSAERADFDDFSVSKLILTFYRE